MQNQISSLAAVPLYQAITDFWMARAALPSEQPAPRSNSPTKHVEAGAEADKVGPLQMQCIKRRECADVSVSVLVRRAWRFPWRGVSRGSAWTRPEST